MADWGRFRGRKYVPSRKVTRPRRVDEVGISGGFGVAALSSRFLSSSLIRSRIGRINSKGSIAGGQIRAPRIGFPVGSSIAKGVPARAIAHSAANSSKSPKSCAENVSGEEVGHALTSVGFRQSNWARASAVICGQNSGDRIANHKSVSIRRKYVRAQSAYRKIERAQIIRLVALCLVFHPTHNLKPEGAVVLSALVSSIRQIYP